MNKKILWGVIILVVLTVLLGGFYCYKVWWPQRQLMISLGLANPNFPWLAYSQEELSRMYPQIKYADVPTRTTPEQTYANFREALRTNNLEMALEQLSQDSEKYDTNKAAVERVFRENKFSEAYKEYPEKIEKESMYETAANYFYFLSKNSGDFKTHISFIKDANGDWKIDSL